MAWSKDLGRHILYDEQEHHKLQFGGQRRFGWIFSGHQIGAASAALATGIVRTEFLTYLPAFFAAGALCVVAAMLILSVPKPSARRFVAAMPMPARS